MHSGRRSLSALGLLLATAFTLRAWHPERMAVEHFDEGVYASNLFSDHLDYRYPSRELYAPPLFPALLEWALILTNARPHAVMWVNVILGTLLVLAVWGTTRELALCSGQLNSGDLKDSGDFKRPVPHGGQADVAVSAAESAALAAAVLTAFSELFIQYSRAALTDVPVCLWIVLAVGAGARSFRTGRWRWAAIAAAFTALGWWTKYNGWLPLAILGAGVAGWGLFSRPDRRQLFGIAARWGALAAGAILLWLPYLWDLQSRGGYAAVAANHRGYLVGMSGWVASLLRHLAIDRHEAMAPTSVGFFLSLCIAGRTAASQAAETDPPSQDSALRRTRRFLPMAFLPLPFLIGLEPCLVLGMLTAVVRRGFQWARQPERCRPSLGAWIVAAWVIGLGLTTPIYRPYPRLVLPWLMGAIIGNCLAWTWILSGSRKPAVTGFLAERSALSPTTDHDQARGRRQQLRFALLALLVSGLVLACGPWSSAWQDRRGLERIAEQLLSTIEKDLSLHERSTHPHLDCVIYVLAEPGLYYQLAAREDQKLQFITQPAANLGMLQPGKIEAGVPTYLAWTSRTARTNPLADAPPKRLELVQEYPYRPSDLVLLDEFAPSALGDVREARVGLSRILPVGGP
jgi:hypothetical protein